MIKMDRDLVDTLTLLEYAKIVDKKESQSKSYSNMNNFKIHYS